MGVLDLVHDHEIDHLNHFRNHDLEDICRRHEAAKATIGEALFIVLRTLATDSRFPGPAIIGARAAVNDLIHGDQVKQFLKCGLASEILDTHDYGLDGAMVGNSSEYFFDASGTDYLSFVERVRELAWRHEPVFGYMAIRFTPGSTALIAMQQHPSTVSVEVATIRSRLFDRHLGFRNDLNDAANSLNAIAHWGQEFGQDRPYIEGRYGPRLAAWRKALGNIEAGQPPVFSTAFSREVGLEPSGRAGILDDDAVDLFFAGLQGAR
jgi:hypothetical protein